ncbi:hypothetical protein SCHAM137S_03278 [Streptomyces chartreusis]
MVVGMDQRVGLQVFQGADIEPVRLHVQRQRLGEGQAFEDLALFGAGAVEDVRGAFAHGRGHRHRAAPRPLRRVLDSGEQSAFAYRARQVAHQPQVAPAQAVQPVDRERFEAGAPRFGGQQPGGVLAGQRLQGEAGQEFAGPQPADRAGRGGAVGGDDQEPGASVHGQLVDQGGRGVVEQMGVVDQQQPYAGQMLEGAVQGGRLGDEVRERGEADTAGLGGAGHPREVGAAGGLGDEAGLAAACRARDHDAVPARGQGPADQLQFVLPAGERPGQFQGLRVAYVGRHGNRSAVTHF